MSGLYPIKPNMVNVCSALGMADDSKNIVVSYLRHIIISSHRTYFSYSWKGGSAFNLCICNIHFSPIEYVTINDVTERERYS